MSYSRPFLTYQQQIERLQNEYKMSIDDNDFALHALSTMSYYDLINGYQEIFIENNKFLEGTTIEYLYVFHLFDNKFQNILFRQSIFVENIFKTRLAYTTAKNLGEHQDKYLDESNYFPNIRSDKNITFNKVKRNIQRVYTKDNHNYIPEPTKHYHKNHNHIPPWILFKNISFGNSINLYRLLKQNEKSEITNAMIKNNSIHYSQKVDFLTNALNIIRTFRNKIAHNLKFITYKSTNKISPKIAKKLSPDFLYTHGDIAKNIGHNDVYSLIVSIVILLDEPFLVSEFLTEILNHISPESDIVPKENKAIQESIYADYSQVTKLPLNFADRINKLLMSYK